MLVLPILLACGDKTDQGGDTAAELSTEIDADADADSDADADADADADSDSDSDADIGSDEGAVSFFLPDPREDFTLSLVQALPSEDSLAFGSTLHSVAASAESIGFSLAAPPAEALTPIDPSLPGSGTAMYAPFLHVDTDGDGEHGSGESVVGTGMTWLMYVQGAETIGLTTGWYGFDVAFSDDGSEGPDLTEPTGIEVSFIPTTEDIAVGGANTSSLSSAGLLILPLTEFLGGTVAEYMLNSPIGADWSFDLGVPPSDHFLLPSDEMLLEMAVEIPVAYDDADASGTLDVGEATQPVCFEGLEVSLVYFPPATSLDTAVFVAAQGSGYGWMAQAEDPVTEERTLLSEWEVLSLEINDDCVYQDEDAGDGDGTAASE